MKNFLEKIKIKDCAIQIGKLKTVKNYQFNDDLEHKSWTPQEDIYFLSGLRTDLKSGTRNTLDTDVIKKNLLFFDFDVRNTEGNCNDIQMEVTIKEILEEIDNNKYFKDYSYAINSGNGLHLFYFGDTIEITDKNIWKAGMQSLNDEISKIYPSDHGCENAGRIMRLPGCINSKVNSHSKILVAKDVHSDLVAHVLVSGKKRMIEKELQAKKQAIENANKYKNSGNDKFSRINNIPVEDIVDKIFGWNWDGKKNWRRDGETATVGCFKHGTENVIVHGGTHEFEPKYEGYSPFMFIKQVKDFNDADTFKWFEAEFPIIKEDIKEEPKPLFNLENLDDVVDEEYGEYKYFVQDLIPREGITILSAQAKTGKSWFILYILSKIIRGEDVFDRKTTPAKILMLDEENTKRGIKRRESKLEDTLKGFGVKILSQNNWKLDIEKHRLELIKMIKENEIELLVVDSFIRIHSQDEQGSGDSQKLYSYFKEIMLDTGVGIILTHHNRKLGKFEKITIDVVRGSGDIVAMGEAVLVLQSFPIKSKEDLKGNTTTIYPYLRESVENQPFKIDWYDNPENEGKVRFEYKGPVIEAQKKQDIAIEKLSAIFNDNPPLTEFTIDDLKKQLGDSDVGEKAIRSAMKVMVEDDDFDSHKGDGKKWNTDYYLKIK